MRRIYRGPKTKYKRELILKESKASRVRAYILTGCKKPQDTNMEEATTPNRADSPEPSPIPTPTLSSRFRNSNNRFIALSAAPSNRLLLTDRLRAVRSKS
jgi:hypothetical protein